jgi:NitT/TauT family transport system substrate-binding protein
MRIRRRGAGAWSWVVLLLALALVAAACGDDDDDDDDDAGGAATTAAGSETSAETTADTEGTGTSADTGGGTDTTGASDTTVAEGAVEGCGEGSTTDPTDLSPDRQPARCEPGAPAAQPLATPATITIAVSNLASEFTGPIVVAQDQGEFEADGVTVEIRELPVTEALPLLVQGEIDAIYSQPDAGVHNAINQGFEVAWVLANFFPGPDSQTGLWSSNNGTVDPADPDLASLRGATIASAVGPGSTINYPLAAALAEAGVGIDEITLQQTPPVDIPTALTNGAVDAGWVLDPFWVALADRDDVAFLAGQPPAEPIGGWLFGPTLLGDERETGEAFVRAWVRTINTYFAEGYKDDRANSDYIAGLLGQDPETFAASPELIFDWEVRQDTVVRMQEVWITLGALDYDTPFPDEEVVDRSFYLQAVGAEG